MNEHRFQNEIYAWFEEFLEASQICCRSVRDCLQIYDFFLSSNEYLSECVVIGVIPSEERRHAVCGMGLRRREGAIVSPDSNFPVRCRTRSRVRRGYLVSRLPPPAFCRRADRAKGKGGPEDDKETVRQVANRLFCSPAVRDRRRTGDSRRMGDFVGQFRARAGRRDARPPPSPATPVRLPFRSRRPVWLGRRPAGRRPHRAGAASDRPCRSGPRSRTSA